MIWIKRQKPARKQGRTKSLVSALAYAQASAFLAEMKIS